jgi:hypothetical protein
LALAVISRMCLRTRRAISLSWSIETVEAWAKKLLLQGESSPIIGPLFGGAMWTTVAKT